MEDLTPAQIVAELDRFIIGQGDAKRAVAVALRNRYRRQQLSEDLRRGGHPRHLPLIGPNRGGKTEKPRGGAPLLAPPFI